MFSVTSLLGMNFSFPDVCLTPIPPAIVPIPYPNFHLLPASLPLNFTVFTTCAPNMNMLCMGLMSLGDFTGVGSGVASATIAFMQRYILGTFTLLICGAPAINTLKMTIQNNTNMIGFNVVPSQYRVLFLKA